MPRNPDQAGWMRWLPGLVTLRRYQPRWLPHDIAAGLVLTTMLVPVGIAYAVASGVPGIYGLYATIVPLLAYALFGPSRILVLGPDSSLAAVILGVVLPLSGGDPQRAIALAGMMAIVSGDRLHPGRRGAAGFCNRASLQAHPLWLHERNRADGADQPAAQALRLLDRERRAVEKPPGDRRSDSWRKDELGCVRGRRRHARGDPPAQAQQARARHPDCRCRRDGDRGRARPCGARRCVGPRAASARPARRSRSRGSLTTISSRF